MITICIGVLGAVVLIASAGNADWGAFFVCAGILVVLMFMAAAEREDTKAWNNWHRYWVNGGSAQYRNVSSEPVRVVQNVVVQNGDAAKRTVVRTGGGSTVQVPVERTVRMASAGQYGAGGGTQARYVYADQLMQCPGCGRVVRGRTIRDMQTMRLYRQYACGNCGRKAV